MAGQTEQPRGETQDAREAAGEIRDEARRVTGEVKDEVEDRADRWSNSLGRRGETLARALHSASDTLRDDGEGGLADLADRAARQVHRMGRYLENEDPAGMMDDLEQTGRSNPAAFLGMAFAAGVLGGRLLRASSPGNGHAQDPQAPGRSRDLQDRAGVTAPPSPSPTDRAAVTAGPGVETDTRAGVTVPGRSGAQTGRSEGPTRGRRGGETIRPGTASRSS